LVSANKTQIPKNLIGKSDEFDHLVVDDVSQFHANKLLETPQTQIIHHKKKFNITGHDGQIKTMDGFRIEQ